MAIIQCPGCGNGVSDKAPQCPKCGYNLATNVQSPAATGGIPAEARKFNWGAFFLYPLWGFANGMWWLFFVNLILAFIPVVGGIAQFVLMIYMGIKGGELAWTKKTWRDLDHFVSVQHSWKVAAIILLVLGVVLGFVLGCALGAGALDAFYYY